eukprot:CAMPEP_0114674904 /NCGR_PEP_ID=MMETSP0191-20121206/47098_1 /TAXON_ID=126664 /ORGANISM="Sorites sp." /LENGTH=30 /DNA_ID= /DNA_START= /DNA_END= /DNA_ORIENTATION=
MKTHQLCSFRSSKAVGRTLLRASGSAVWPG